MSIILRRSVRAILKLDLYISLSCCIHSFWGV